jgi:Rod binding domain-containing protein
MDTNGTSVKTLGQAGAGTKAALDARAQAKVRTAAKEFEAILLNTLMKSMRTTIPKSGLDDSGFGNDIMESMFDEELSRHIADKGNLGFGEMLYRNLLDRMGDGTPVVSEEIPGTHNAAKASHPGKILAKIGQKESPAAISPAGEHGVGPVNAEPVAPKPKPAVGASAPAVPAVASAKPAAAAPQVSAIPASELPGNWAPRTIVNRIKAINAVVEEAAAKHGVDSTVIRAVIAAESGGNPNAQSNRDAKGLMQLRDSTAAAMGVSQIFDPRENVFGGTRYLRQLLDQFGGNLDLALASYNAGPAAVEKHGGIPPYRETKAYVKNVKSMIQAMSRTKEERNEGH